MKNLVKKLAKNPVEPLLAELKSFPYCVDYILKFKLWAKSGDIISISGFKMQIALLFCNARFDVQTC